uniref:Uncharacterized protein n=1 Tax=Siphoviridae sp. ctVzN31 TaxID=2825534 RepID=A0A8S5NXV5_9CAUD|nr:MAG TPA: hypothetical protein [Siphoviridae sp. ctVzN31]
MTGLCRRNGVSLAGCTFTIAPTAVKVNAQIVQSVYTA